MRSEIQRPPRRPNLNDYSHSFAQYPKDMQYFINCPRNVVVGIMGKIAQWLL
jgi:hypothetical protein